MGKTTVHLLDSQRHGCQEPDGHSTLWYPDTWQLLKSWSSVSWFRPTHAHLSVKDGVTARWNSRAHRKGRAPLLRMDDGRRVRAKAPPVVLLSLNLDSVAWWVGCIFTVASVVWVINGWYSFAPLPDAWTTDKITGVTALLGGGMFIVGGYLAVLESLNADATAQQGYSVQRVASADDAWQAEALPQGPVAATVKMRLPGGTQKWRWWGWEPHSMGFMENFIVFVGAIIFYVPCCTGYYTIFSNLSPILVNFVYWLPQVVASVCFVLSGTLATLEVQEQWYKPRPLNLGWQAAFWNTIGGWGFLLCGAFGFASSNPNVAKWGVALSTLWGSVAFLLGSYAQWLESMNTHELSFEQ